MSRTPDLDMPERHLCGCCEGRTIMMVLDRQVRMCGCDPDKPRCHQCSRGRCHCRCVPAKVENAPPADRQPVSTEVYA